MENASLYPLKCGFCGHANPADSRYCNACGAPFSVQPCPRCGTTNDATATTCQECDAPLADSEPHDFFLPLPPEAPAPFRSTPGAAEETADAAFPRQTAAAAGSMMIDDRAPSSAELVSEGAALGTASVAASRLREVAVPLPPAEAAAPTSPRQPTAATTAAAPDTVPIPGDQGPPHTEASASSESVLFHAAPEGSPRGRTLGWAAMLTALGVAVYFAYGYFQRFQPSDVARRPVATDKPAAGSTAVTPTDTGKPAVAGASLPAVPAGDSAGGKGGHGIDPAGSSARPQPPTDIFITKPEPDQRRAPPQAQEAAKAAAAGTQGEIRRPATGDRAGVAQRPPASGTCTDALAALGLCTQENTQRRKP